MALLVLNIPSYYKSLLINHIYIFGLFILVKTCWHSILFRNALFFSTCSGVIFYRTPCVPQAYLNSQGLTWFTLNYENIFDHTNNRIFSTDSFGHKEINSHCTNISISKNYTRNTDICATKKQTTIPSQYLKCFSLYSFIDRVKTVH